MIGGYNGGLVLRQIHVVNKDPPYISSITHEYGVCVHINGFADLVGTRRYINNLYRRVNLSGNFLPYASGVNSLLAGRQATSHGG